ncbi:hypothetical protein LIER_29579 [Lithospermum erythrorhizon]|uniref:SWIM-type domain-containing protein n=1 Tax=Lithospermum erythrorhizon TaxID=34254 RepID=A0AAV3RL62_LITER
MTDRDAMLKWKGKVCPRVHETLQEREKLASSYITRASGSSRYSVSTAQHGFVVDTNKMVCSCGLWQLGGVPCVHVVCVYKSLRKDPRLFVHKYFTPDNFLAGYSHYLKPLRGNVFWPKTSYTPILPPDMRVLPGRPKKCRRVDPSEKAVNAAKERAKKDEADKAAGIFKASK